MGFLKVSAEGIRVLREVLAELLADPANKKAGMPRLLQELLKRRQPIRVLYTVGHWLDINNLDDMVQAGDF
jgi:phosphoenolpyruvate phosphomutase